MTDYPEHIRKLIDACRNSPGPANRDVLVAISDPQWEKAGRTNDWRRFVTDSVADTWPSLGLEARLVAYLTAAVEASLQ